MARIVVADDDAVTRDLVLRALTGAGHDVVAAADGQEAFDIVSAAPASVALVIADVQMPLIDGVTLAGRLRTAAPGVKVLLMSGLAEGQVRAAAAVDGAAVAFLMKPFALDALRAKVDDLMR
jgi:CheY-like chemotaxis protein